MSEDMPRPGEENYVQDKDLAHDMALAEDAGRTEATKTQEAVEGIAKLAVDGNFSYGPNGDKVLLNVSESQMIDPTRVDDGKGPNFTEELSKEEYTAVHTTAHLKEAHNSAIDDGANQQEALDAMRAEGARQAEYSLDAARAASEQVQQQHESATKNP